MSSTDKFTNKVENQWCPGCPNFGILRAFKKAFAEMGKEPHEICMVSGIGQAAKLPHYLNCNFFNGLHGRALPVALGINAANPEMTTLVVTGDGDCYGEGGNHFIHTILRNPDITVVVHNNELYALTKGQASPTTLPGEKRTLQLKGVEKRQINMPAIAIANGCTFVARGFAGDIEHLKDLIIEAVSHRGFSYIDIVQPCITWDKRPVSWFKERVYRLGDEHDPGDVKAAVEAATESTGKIPIGIFYKLPPGNLYAARYRKAVSDTPLPRMPAIDPTRIKEILGQYYPR